MASVDGFATEYVNDRVVGGSLDRCAFLSFRRPSNEVLCPWRMESCVVQPLGDGAELSLGPAGLLTGLWASPAGRLYATRYPDELYTRQPGESSWHRLAFGAHLELLGVGGTSDETLFVWGRDVDRPRMWRLRNRGFEEVPSPGNGVRFVTGVDAERAFVAGEGGMLSRWTQDEWLPLEVGVRHAYTCLHQAGGDELWATTEYGKLVEITGEGACLRSRLDAPLYSVCRWNGALWVAAGPRGLFRLDEPGRELVPEDPSTAAIGLSGGEDLLVLTEDAVEVRTSSGSSTLCEAAFLHARASVAPWWTEEAS